jgi:hypothetical protein
LAPILAWPVAVVSQNAAAWIVSIISSVDRGLVAAIPGLGNGCWYVVMDAGMGDRETDN